MTLGEREIFAFRQARVEQSVPALRLADEARRLREAGKVAQEKRQDAMKPRTPAYMLECEDLTAAVQHIDDIVRGLRQARA